jgi:spore coat polysaccharide biosynthesis protein SpsF
MGSTRLPGKVMIPIEGKPLILHVIDRLLPAHNVDLIILATTTNARDDPLVKLVEGYHAKVKVFRGSEENVLERYYGAATKYHASTIVRITSDCPFADYHLVDELIGLFSKGSFDYLSNVLGDRTYPRGLDAEVLSIATLRTILSKELTDADREHVTWYVKKHPEEFKTQSVQNNTDLSHLRWTVDEPDDLTMVREVYRRLYPKNPLFSTEDILALLKQEPALAEINSHVEQKIIEGRSQ